MAHYNIEARSSRVKTELSSQYRGHAKIALGHLHFSSSGEADEKKIRHLQRVFKQVGCDRQNPSHFISATIEADVLHASLRYSQRNADDLRRPEPPELRLPAGRSIQCLDGYHRILALGTLNRNITWWPVKLYTDLSREACGALKTEFAHEGKCSDGEIVANILCYPEHSVDANQEWAKLDKTKPRILRSILRHPKLSPAFKNVMRIPGLRSGLLLATWNKVFHCIEEVINYLELIYDTWVNIMGSEGALDYVDNDGVRELESRVPGVSCNDELHVEFMLRNETIFRTLLDGKEREQIFENLKRVKYLIPSIRTLQEDFKYIRPCAQVMKKLLVDKDLQRLSVTVQAIARNAFSMERSIDFEGTFLHSLKKLYLFIMQDVCQLSGLPPLRDSEDEDDYKLLPCDANSWSLLAKEARRLGFCSDEIVRWCDTDPDRETAIKALRDARPPSHFDYGSNFEQLVTTVVRAFEKAKKVRPPKPDAKLTSQVGEPVARRCGRVYSNTYDQDRCCINYGNMVCEVPKDRDITSLFVRRSVFHAFWGLPDDRGGAEADGPGEDQGNLGVDESMDEGHQDEEAEADGQNGDQEQQGEDESMDDDTRQDEEDQEMEDLEATVIQGDGRHGNMSREKRVLRNPTKKARREDRQKLKRRLQQTDKRPNPPIRTVEQVPQQQAPQEMMLTAVDPTPAERPASAVSALTTFIPAPVPVLVQDSPKTITIHVYTSMGQWTEERTSRNKVCQDVSRILKANATPTLRLYNPDGIGIALEDCADLEDICLTTEHGDGLPLEVMY
ncbi:hypothetical protein PG985_006702 [Apiospora marii]|uniref:DGQHR domain-containing protein n=1 Tax=Apiospora marii TaxID=335849 RepID=A0ABR1SAL6_9PEZI